MRNRVACPRKCGERKSALKGKLDPAEESARAEMFRLRSFLGWTQHRAAFELGVRRETVSAWEMSEPSRHQRVPAAARDRLRRFAVAAGFDGRESLREAV